MRIKNLELYNAWMVYYKNVDTLHPSEKRTLSSIESNKGNYPPK